MYKVKLSNTYVGVYFSFKNWDDAMSFISMAIESGSADDKHIEATCWCEEDERGLE